MEDLVVLDLGSSDGGPVPTSEELAEIALEAAVQLELQRCGRPADNTKVLELAASLERAPSVPGASGTRRMLSDPQAALAVYRAIQRLNHEARESPEEIENRIESYVNRLREWNPQSQYTGEEIANLRIFCLGLHDQFLKEVDFSVGGMR